jgi:hypothetical protein
MIVEPVHTFGSGCEGTPIDPLNVRWFNADWTGVAANVTALLPRWGRVGGSTQYA